MAAWLYKGGGDTKIHGVDVYAKVFQDDEVEAATADGWFDKPLDAHEAHLEAMLEAAPEPKPVPRKRGRPRKVASDADQS